VPFVLNLFGVLVGILGSLATGALDQAIKERWMLILATCVPVITSALTIAVVSHRSRDLRMLGRSVTQAYGRALTNSFVNGGGELRPYEQPR
jgi:hypothetical protein